MKPILENLRNLDMQIFRSLTSHPNLQSLSDVEFKTTDQHIRLCGKVTSFFEKQIAQETIRAIDPDRSIENELSVEWLSA